MNNDTDKMKREIKLNQLPFTPVSMFFGGLRPAVFRRGKDNKEYGIRIKTGESWRGDNRSESWDYFELDETGLIISSPRGYAKEYNKKVRITDIEEAVEEYKDKII